jgi:hypothetical protein
VAAVEVVQPDVVKATFKTTGDLALKLEAALQLVQLRDRIPPQYADVLVAKELSLLQAGLTSIAAASTVVAPNVHVLLEAADDEPGFVSADIVRAFELAANVTVISIDVQAQRCLVLSVNSPSGLKMNTSKPLRLFRPLSQPRLVKVSLLTDADVKDVENALREAVPTETRASVRTTLNFNRVNKNLKFSCIANLLGCIQQESQLHVALQLLFDVIHISFENVNTIKLALERQFKMVFSPRLTQAGFLFFVYSQAAADHLTVSFGRDGQQLVDIQETAAIGACSALAFPLEFVEQEPPAECHRFGAQFVTTMEAALSTSDAATLRTAMNNYAIVATQSDQVQHATKMLSSIFCFQYQ